jgi:hypothetical protein
MAKKILSMLLIAGASLLCVAGTAFAADVPSAMVGTWKLNVDKTQWNGPPALKSYTVTITNAGSGKVKDVQSPDAQVPGFPTAGKLSLNSCARLPPYFGNQYAGRS